jgi:4-hydroxy-tetrahydrodipicolinate reductase
MTKIAIAGACGRMGQALLKLAASQPGLQVAAAFDAPGRPGLPGMQPQLSASAAEAIAAADVLIDFTAPQATLAHLELAAAAGKAVVIGTTGFSPAERQALVALSSRVPVVLSSNYSVGVNVLWKALDMVARVTGDAYDVEVIETHHHDKKDAPSGTAMTTAEVLAKALGRGKEDFVYGRHGLMGARSGREIGIHAVRGGDIVGDHTVLFAGPGERLEFKHQAHSRENFAAGALKAAEWLSGRPAGLYSMQQVLGLA